MPADVRKGSAFPTNFSIILEAAPRGTASRIYKSNDGTAEPFRTSGGRAAILGLNFKHQSSAQAKPSNLPQSLIFNSQFLISAENMVKIENLLFSLCSTEKK